MEIYKENIQRFKDFYNSDYYSLLKNTDPNYTESLFDFLNCDPDGCDRELYCELGSKFSLPYRSTYLIDEVNSVKIKLSADIICGRNQISDYHDNNFEKWIQDYELIRSNLNLHLIWPKHKVPTINTYRYTKYLDRIDCLLYDLKRFFEGDINTPMIPVYCNESEGYTTSIWLREFTDFESFIDKMQLGSFVDKNYNVLDISKKQMEPLDRILTTAEVRASLNTYLETLLTLIREGRFQ